ncbi:MAG: DUF1461 domain-containing protein [Chloroflexi bacterium]|nr:MAG: DUF1461 domain-containing protein [Chloroflexota bacterium]
MPTQIAKTLKLFVILLIPILVIGGAASLLATDRYLAFEYGKAGFPPDPFGFTQQQRFDLASSNIHYVRAHLSSDALTNQTLDGGAVYNTREVSHMADFQAVFQSVLRAWRVTFILLLLVGFILWQKRGTICPCLGGSSGWTFDFRYHNLNRPVGGLCLAILVQHIPSLFLQTGFLAVFLL